MIKRQSIPALAFVRAGICVLFLFFATLARAQTDSLRAGLYFGVTTDTLGVQHPWLLYLDGSNSGAIYNLAAIGSHAVTVDRRAGHITIMRTSKNEGDPFRFVFHGIVSGNDLLGSYKMLDTTSFSSLSPVPLSLKRVELTSSDIARGMGIVYSDVRYIEEAADVLGSEVIILPSQEQPIVIFSDAEGETRPPMYGEVKSIEKGKITFELKEVVMDGGKPIIEPLTFSILPSAKNVKLFSSGKLISTLKRRSAISDILKRQRKEKQ